MANFSTHRSYTVPRVANALTLTVVGVAVWWSGAQRPAPVPQQMARATAVAAAEPAPPAPRQPVARPATAALQTEPAITRTASITPVVYLPGAAAATPR